MNCKANLQGKADSCKDSIVRKLIEYPQHTESPVMHPIREQEVAECKAQALRPFFAFIFTRFIERF